MYVYLGSMPYYGGISGTTDKHIIHMLKTDRICSQVQLILIDFKGVDNKLSRHFATVSKRENVRDSLFSFRAQKFPSEKGCTLKEKNLFPVGVGRGEGRGQILSFQSTSLLQGRQNN